MDKEEENEEGQDGVGVAANPPLQGDYAGPGEDHVTTVAMIEDGVVKKEEGGVEEREVWGKKIDFLLSVIGFAVDLANIWRFPYLCYKNGGGVFLIPYVLMLIFGGIPLFYMELALGQFNRTGAITCWSRICPLFKGIGWAVVLIAFYTDFFYNVIIAWCLHFFISSFTTELPWTSCNNTWNTPRCYIRTENASEVVDNNITSAITDIAKTVHESLFNTTFNASAAFAKEFRRTPAEEYFERGMLELHESKGIFEVGTIKWQMVLCLLGVYFICYFSLWKGISTSGKVVWFTAIFPYVVLFILMIRGATLPGSLDGIHYYLTPNITKLQESEVWVDAATQVFFSLGPGFGVLLAYASYNPIHNNVYRDALITSCINCATSFMSGFVIFMILGYMADKTGIDIKNVVAEGPGLIFVAYPEAIATLPWSTFWALIFFLMLLTLGLDSSFGGSEAILTALSDEFPWMKKKRELIVGILFLVYFVVGLASCSQGGAYVVTLMDKFAAGYSILFAVFFECLAVSWAYSVERFSGDIQMMIGSRPGIYWVVCWKYVAPIFIVFNIVFGLVNIPVLKYGSYIYPTGASGIGWCLAMSSVLCIPGFAIYGFIRAEGTPMQRMRHLLKSTQPHRTTLYGAQIRLNGGMPGDPV